MGVGLLSGFMSGALGIGGGMIMTTALTMMPNDLTEGMTQHEVVGTSLAAMVPLGMFTTSFHWMAGNVVLKQAAAIGAGACAGIAGTSLFAAEAIPEEFMQRFLAGVLLVSAVPMIAKTFRKIPK